VRGVDEKGTCAILCHHSLQSIRFLIPILSRMRSDPIWHSQNSLVPKWKCSHRWWAGQIDQPWSIQMRVISASTDRGRLSERVRMIQRRHAIIINALCTLRAPNLCRGFIDRQARFDGPQVDTPGRGLLKSYLLKMCRLYAFPTHDCKFVLSCAPTHAT